MESTFSIDSGIAREIADHYKTGLERELGRAQDSLVREVLQRSLEVDAEKLGSVLEACFFASLEPEEGRTHDFSIAVAPPPGAMSNSVIEKVPPNVFAQTYAFKNPLPIDKLSDIAPALATTRQRIGVWFDDNEAKIWGFSGTDTRTSAALQITTFQPGQLGVSVPLCAVNRLYLVSATRAEAISGDLSLAELLFDEDDRNKRRSPDHLTQLRYCSRIPRRTRLLMDIANRMRGHAHGGALLVIPAEDTTKILKQSIRPPLTMASETSFGFIRQKLEKEEDESLYAYERQLPYFSLPWSFDNEAQLVAQTTAVDGATIMTKDFDLIAFGTKIEKASKDLPDQVLVSEPFQDSRRPQPRPLSDLGGNRHQSAAQFVFDQRKAFAIVASQDGRISVITWDLKEQMVSVVRHAEYLFVDIAN
jgi:hypothetical protein